MSKGQEALKELGECLLLEGALDSINQERIGFIAKELKEYEEMKRIKGTTTLDNALEETLINACPNVAKKLKALENIKVILKDFIEFNVIELPHINKVHYEIKIFENAIYVSKEKYDLLKEVFS